MKILRLDFSLWNVYILAIGVAVVVLLNTARIGVMAYSYDQYIFWHLGPGLTIVKITMLHSCAWNFLLWTEWEAG